MMPCNEILQTYVGDAEQSDSGKPSRFQPYINNGGSVVAIAGDDFAVIGADTRLSQHLNLETRGANKLFTLSPSTVLGATGCWCDVLTITRHLQLRMRMYEFEHMRTMTTPAVAQVLATLLYYKRFFPYYVLNILAGLDEHGQGCVYFYDPIGHYERLNYRGTGTAGVEIQPVLDSHIGHLNRQNDSEFRLNKSEALTILKDCFIGAAERDIYTGDNIQINIITADSIEEQTFSLRKD